MIYFSHSFILLFIIITCYLVVNEVEYNVLVVPASELHSVALLSRDVYLKKVKMSIE